jgi:hypothetical protein
MKCPSCLSPDEKNDVCTCCGHCAYQEVLGCDLCKVDRPEIFTKCVKDANNKLDR